MKRVAHKHPSTRKPVGNPQVAKTSVWKRHPSVSVERLAVQWEALMDWYIARGDHATVRKAEYAWLDAYGDAEQMRVVYDAFAPNQDTKTVDLKS